MGELRKIIFGDWSDDGHGKTGEFIVDIPENFSSADLKASYDQTVKEFGFNIDSFVTDYEDCMLPPEYSDVLKQHGFDKLADANRPSWSDDYVFVSPKLLLDIFMFMVGYHLEDFTWKNLSADIPLLVGGHRAIIENSAGYGIYS